MVVSVPQGFEIAASHQLDSLMRFQEHSKAAFLFINRLPELQVVPALQ
jgi:hypothetical protein